MPRHEIHHEVHQDVSVFTLSGYFDERGGKALTDQFVGASRRGFRKFIVDLSQGPVIASPTVAMLLEIVMRIYEHPQGRLIVSGPTRLHRVTFTLVGIFPQAGQATTLAEALAQMLTPAPVPPPG